MAQHCQQREPAEVITLLDEDPGITEVLVENVKSLRYAEARGDYDSVVQTLNASDPHAAS